MWYAPHFDVFYNYMETPFLINQQWLAYQLFWHFYKQLEPKIWLNEHEFRTIKFLFK